MTKTKSSTKSKQAAAADEPASAGSRLAAAAAVMALLLLLVWAPTILQKLRPDWWKQLAGLGRTGAHKAEISLTWLPGVAATARTIVTLVVVAVVLLAIVAAVLKAHQTKREEVRGIQRDALLTVLQKALPPGFLAKHMRVRTWQGDIPSRVVVDLPQQTPVQSIEWRLGFSQAVQSVMGEISPIQWPAGRRRRIELRKLSNKDIERGTSKSGDSLEERIVSALTGLVPSPQPTITADAEHPDRKIIDVRYGKTTRDVSPNWRYRVVTIASMRLDQKFRATWDHQKLRFRLEPVPPLPSVVPWQDSFVLTADQDSRPGRWMGVYGIDEEHRLVGWEPSDREPHALFTGDPGTGKTEAIKAFIASMLRLGALVAISDPKQKDFAEFLGRPGVICVAQTVEDRVGMLIDLHAEMKRRTSAGALRKLETRYLGAAEDRATAAIDDLPIVVVMDELTQHTKDVQKWWAALSKDERVEWLGTDSRVCPALSYPGEIVQLARAVKLHVLVGMQRADAANFGGDSTAMRDMIAHHVSMGQLSPIGSEMQYGDRQIGSEVVIEGVGEGMSNGTRFDGKKVLSRQVPGRFKALYTADICEQDEFWDQVATAAPDASLVALPHVSAAARDPYAAIDLLRRQASGEEVEARAPIVPEFRPTTPPIELPVDDQADRPDVDDQADRSDVDDQAAELDGPHASWAALVTDEPADEPADEVMEEVATSTPTPAPAGDEEIAVGDDEWAAAVIDFPTEKTRQADKAPAEEKVPSAVPADAEPEQPEVTATPGVLTAEFVDQMALPDVDESGLERDVDGTVWERNSPAAVEEGQMISIGDLVEARVVEAQGVFEDEFDGSEVWRFVVDNDGEEEVIDLNEEDVVLCRQLRKAA